MRESTRRSVLSAFGAGSLTGLSGCLGGSSTTLGEYGSRLEARARERVADVTDDRPVRCRGDPVDTARAESDDPGYDDGIEFFPRYGTVKYVRYSDADGPVAFGTMSFERWASMQCAKAALARVRVVTADRVGTEEFGSALTVTPRPFFNELVVEVSHSTTEDGDGNVVGESAVSFETLLAETPRRVDVTYRLDGKRFGRSVPVYATESRYQQL